MSRRHGLQLVTLAVLALLMQYPLPVAEFGRDALLLEGAQLFLSDVPLLLLMGLSAPDLAHGIRRGRLGTMTTLWLIVATILTISWLVHPSLRGIETILRALGAVTIAVTIQSLPAPARRIACYALITAAGVQVAWALAQVANDRGVPGFAGFGEPLYYHGGMPAVRGLMIHPYVLAALGALAAAIVTVQLSRADVPSPRWRWLAATLLIPIGLTYSRAAALTGALLAGATFLRLRDVTLAIALLLGFVVPAALTSSGWLTRTTETLNTEGPTLADSREVLSAQATTIILDAPLLGVGPGLYRAELFRRGAMLGAPGVIQPAHSVPLLVAAEGGLAAGFVALVLLAVAIARGLRGPSRAAVIAAALLVPFALDHFTYTRMQGVILFGFWIGLCDLFARREAVD